MPYHKATLTDEIANNMKRYHLTLAASLLLASCSGEKPARPLITVDGPIVHEVAISVRMNDLRTQLGDPMHIRVSDATDPSSLVPHQLDDLDGDGSADEVFILVGPSDDPLRMTVQPSETAADLPSRTQAVLAVRQDGRFEDGAYVEGSDYVSVRSVEVPAEQEQDSDWAMYEGPVWESDRVGWRYYLDDRNRIDIFGKKTSDLVLHEHYDDYHSISDWGADILKVGESLGIGSAAIETDSGPKVIDNAATRRVDIVANGPLRSIIRTTYSEWMVGDRSLDVVSELENRAGQRWTEHRIDLAGDTAGVVMLTGIVKHPGAPDLVSGEEAGIFFAFTYGPQTDQGHGLGMAILVPPDYAPELGTPDSLTHLVRMTPLEGRVGYRFLASWELEPDSTTNPDAFEALVRWAASNWAAERATWVAIH